MILAKVEDGVVTNTIEVSPESIPGWAEGWPEISDGAGIGWIYDGEAFTAPPAPEAEPIPPPPLTFLQLMIGLVAEGWITEAEGDAWLGGTPPPQVGALISQLPADEQFPARARAKRFSIAERDDPLVNDLAQIEGKTPEELDAFFWEYSQL